MTILYTHAFDRTNLCDFVLGLFFPCDHNLLIYDLSTHSVEDFFSALRMTPRGSETQTGEINYQVYNRYDLWEQISQENGNFKFEYCI